MRPFQIIFNPTSAAELARMPKELQLSILGEFRGLPHEVMSTDLERFGKLERAGKTLHRFRIGDYRIYFERHDLGVVVHRILSRNSLKDFLFRSSLPVGEDEALQQNPKFWELIESVGTQGDGKKISVTSPG
jgi:mRNA-degrading endonuclease RelE of RelBE toxin-antitoxin system